MATDESTSGPVRPFTAEEIGGSDFSDFRLLSRSQQNCVWRVSRGGRLFVFKTLNADAGDVTRNRMLLEREYDIMRRIDNLYVVRVWQWAEIEGRGEGILMEYVDGCSLADFIAGNKSAKARRRVFNELLEAVGSLHELGILHNDLKLSNVLITRVGDHVRLIDFGLADSDAYIAKNLGGTPKYAAPETSDKSHKPSPAKDIYSLGIILRHVFPVRYRLIVSKCINADPKHRYESAEQLGNAMRRTDRLLWVAPLMIVAVTAVILVALLPVSVVYDNHDVPLVPDTVVVSRVDTVIVNTIDTVVLANRIDTVVLANQKDNELEKLFLTANQKCREFYEAATDSLRNLKDYSEYLAPYYISKELYYDRVNATRDSLIKAHPKYDKELRQHFNYIFERDKARTRARLNSTN